MIKTEQLNEIQKTEHPNQDIFLQRIPEEVYTEMVTNFSKDYQFSNGEENGGNMRIANYFVGISRKLANDFVSFIREMQHKLTEGRFPQHQLPPGFKPVPRNLLAQEKNGNGFSFGSFDLAVSDIGLHNIEFQAVATYPISAARLNRFLAQKIENPDISIFADSASTTWEEFKKIYQRILGGRHQEEVYLTDINLHSQKTNFEFFATQKELDISVKLADRNDIFESENRLYHQTPGSSSPSSIHRLYNRILLSDAIFDQHYPVDEESWKFRFDCRYDHLKFINHPSKQFDISKRLSPYIKHPFNPPCFELTEVLPLFEKGVLEYKDFVWKHKWGAAGKGLFLSPSPATATELQGITHQYIAQKKIAYTTFKTDDGQEKIIELRFMTAHHQDQCIIVPMARIGHVVRTTDGSVFYKIHFADNNQKGYGFSPVLIFE
ncbi:hypothetical protein ACFSTE_08100 [Aquimarina hainanensis]|uniref:Uncharacterized protein n=1 Tax=Aquimarina hainanensis TaxID=1578017 RepID=A0ABW5N761_9FLAO|nr:hypothetical protein [Aquimarina sp. TRL1]QKX05204.1 hypothetical protein HN014_09805 [Aquimarina sp. TRL1]